LRSTLSRSEHAGDAREVAGSADVLEDVERCGLNLLQEEVAGKRVNVIDSKTPADRVFSILKRIPREAHARRKIPKRRVVVKGTDTAAGRARLRRDRRAELDSAGRRSGS